MSWPELIPFDTKAKLVRLEAINAELLEALEALWNEVQWSGNDKSTNDGWPNAIKLTKTAISKAKGE